MNSRSDPACRRGQRGMTLLEVMVAFAILALITGMVTQIFIQNLEKGTNALSRRELREAGDTIFRKMLYEWEEYKDGYTRTLDEEYAHFARLKGLERDRWMQYRVELEKKEMTVVGSDPEGDSDAELFSGEGTVTSGSTGTTTGSTTSTDGETDAAATGIKLTRVTIRIYYTDPTEYGGTGEPLMVVSTWVDPNKGQVAPK